MKKFEAKAAWSLYARSAHFEVYKPFAIAIRTFSLFLSRLLFMAVYCAFLLVVLQHECYLS